MENNLTDFRKTGRRSSIVSYPDGQRHFITLSITSTDFCHALPNGPRFGVSANEYAGQTLELLTIVIF
jgi:hypothetical protein